MKAFLTRFLAPLTLLEWGGILLYFFFSGRIAAFLHPTFRPLIPVAGVLLCITALVLLFGGSECCGHDEEEGHVHTHEHSGFRNVLSFLILLLPIALATGFSPDAYGANMVRNRGLVSTAPTLPRSAASRPAPTPVAYVGVEQPAVTATPVPAVQRAGESPAPTLAVGEPPLPTEDGKPEPTASPAPSPQFQNPSLKLNARGHLEADLLDLVYAAEDPSMMKDFAGQTIEVIGQVVHRKEAEHEKGPFQLIRFVMSCCAADAQPIAVLVDYPKAKSDFKSMTWVKVTGRVEFRQAGPTWYAAITPIEVKPTAAPADQYLY